MFFAFHIKYCFCSISQGWACQIRPFFFSSITKLSIYFAYQNYLLRLVQVTESNHFFTLPPLKVSITPLNSTNSNNQHIIEKKGALIGFLELVLLGNKLVFRDPPLAPGYPWNQKFYLLKFVLDFEALIFDFEGLPSYLN